MLAALGLLAALCAPMTSQNVGLVYYNGVHNCTPIMDSCEVEDPMVFRAAGAFSAACGPYTFSWRFSDGSVFTGWQAFKTFTTAGVHSVELAITNPTQTFRQTRIIAINARPFSLLAAPQSSNTGSSTFRFDAVPAISADYGQWVWNFGDGTVIATTQPSIIHKYAKSGSYVVTLSASNAVPTAAARVNATVVAVSKRRVASR